MNKAEQRPNSTVAGWRTSFNKAGHDALWSTSSCRCMETQSKNRLHCVLGFLRSFNRLQKTFGTSTGRFQGDAFHEDISQAEHKCHLPSCVPTQDSATSPIHVPAEPPVRCGRACTTPQAIHAPASQSQWAPEVTSSTPHSQPSQAQLAKCGHPATQVEKTLEPPPPDQKPTETLGTRMGHQTLSTASTRQREPISATNESHCTPPRDERKTLNLQLSLGPAPLLRTLQPDTESPSHEGAKTLHLTFLRAA